MTCLALGIGPAESINLGAEDLEGREMPMIARTVYSGTHLATCFSISPPGDGLPASAGCRSHCKKAEGSSERGMGESVGDAGQEEDPW